MARKNKASALEWMAVVAENEEANDSLDDATLEARLLLLQHPTQQPTALAATSITGQALTHHFRTTTTLAQPAQPEAV